MQPLRRQQEACRSDQGRCSAQHCGADTDLLCSLGTGSGFLNGDWPTRHPRRFLGFCLEERRNCCWEGRPEGLNLDHPRVGKGFPVRGCHAGSLSSSVQHTHTHTPHLQSTHAGLRAPAGQSQVQKAVQVKGAWPHGHTSRRSPAHALVPRPTSNTGPGRAPEATAPVFVSDGNSEPEIIIIFLCSYKTLFY